MLQIGVLAVLAGLQEPPLPPGLTGPAGTLADPKRVTRLIIDTPGVYENYLVDAGWGTNQAVKIRADGVTLRNCEIRNNRHNGIGVFARDTVIENVRIHHLLKGTFKDQQDAHGITGTPFNLVVRNCEIYYVSGDAIQFDPTRRPWGDVRVEHCVLWTGPLPEDAAGFRKGERPGENALDTKQDDANPRSVMTLSGCIARGWRQPGQIDLMAAFNIKNKVDVRIRDCVFDDNEVGLRLRGTGTYAGAWVTAERCFFYKSDVAVRAEDAIERLKLIDGAYGKDVRRRFRAVSGKPVDPEIRGDREAPPLEEVLKGRRRE